MKRLSLFETLLSVFVVYHLFAVMLTPMLIPPFDEGIRPWTRLYVSSLEFTNLWEFFAPNPAVPANLQWQAEDDRGSVVAQGVWPRPMVPGPISDAQVRRSSALYIMLGSDEYVEKMFVPYLCRQDPGYLSVRIWKEARPVPVLLDVASGKRSIADTSDADKKFVAHAFCERGIR